MGMLSWFKILTPVIIAIGLGYLTWYKNKVGPNGFGFSTTATQVSSGIDLSGKVVLVTGATNGLGFETSKVFSVRGAVVILTGRTKEKAENSRKELVRTLQIEGINERIIPLALDLASISSIEKFVGEFDKLNLPLHFLINNAGVGGFSNRTVTEDGFEIQMGTNHIGHFHLTNLLTNKLINSAPSRIVMVSSEAHKVSNLSFLEDPFLESSPYKFFVAYGNSKLANILHAAELDKRLRNEGVRAFSLHPGGIATGMSKNFPTWVQNLLGAFLPLLQFTIFKTIDQGTATQVYAALLAKESDGGQYFDDCQVKEIGFPDLLYDHEKREKLWNTTTSLIKNAQNRLLQKKKAK